MKKQILLLTLLVSGISGLNASQITPQDVSETAGILEGFEIYGYMPFPLIVYIHELVAADNKTVKKWLKAATTHEQETFIKCALEIANRLIIKVGKENVATLLQRAGDEYLSSQKRRLEKANGLQ